jgi:hypothetical protein
MSTQILVDSITCPITQEVMHNPVIAPDGHTYEKSAIIECLTRYNRSPLTRQIMSVSDITVNASMKYLCDAYHEGRLSSISIPSEYKYQLPKDPTISTDNIKLIENLEKTNENYIRLKLQVDSSTIPHTDTNYLSQDIIIVIDRSGSMNTAVQAKDQDGNNMEDGMSVQDIVNHAAKTVVNTLDKNSRLSVIIFDNLIEMLFDLLPMTDMNKITALDKITGIKPRAQTNIWGALEMAIDVLDSREDKSRNGAILMLTDGAPNISPARGEVETLKRLRISKNFTSPIYTFGFGYNLQKDLLYNIAKYANGGNAHIPDGGMIATVFCNFIGTILSTVVMNLQLHIKSENVLPKDLIMGDFAYYDNQETGYRIYDIGTIQTQQARNIIINNSHNLNYEMFYTYKICGKAYKSEVISLNQNLFNGITTNKDVHVDIFRLKTVETLNEIINSNLLDCSKLKLKLDNLINTISAFTETYDSNLLNGIFENLVDQVTIAISNNVYYTKWGKFYIQQLMRSLNQEIKPNFKDEACKFGGEVFESIVDKASDIFDTLPPPIPSLMVTSPSNPSAPYTGMPGQGPIVPQRIATLQGYNVPSNPCFDSNCLITMADGSKKKLKKLGKNDVIMSRDENNNYTTSKVLCILETIITMGILEMVNFDEGLIITPWHPIKHNGNWKFPINLKNPVMKSCNSIISLVLDNNHIAIINDVECITLGHGFTYGVLNHKYFGTNLVIDDMKKLLGWELGHIVVKDSCIIKDIFDNYKLINNNNLVKVC